MQFFSSNVNRICRPACWPQRLSQALFVLVLVAIGPAVAQPATDPVLATVNGEPIHLSDIKDAADTLPPQARGMPPQTVVSLAARSVD